MRIQKFYLFNKNSNNFEFLKIFRWNFPPPFFGKFHCPGGRDISTQTTVNSNSIKLNYKNKDYSYDINLNKAIEITKDDIKFFEKNNNNEKKNSLKFCYYAENIVHNQWNYIF